MPDAPSWNFVADAARKITDKKNEIYGICLRGKAGWGENTAFLTATANSFGARWFDENWQPQFDQPEWKNTLKFYLDLMKDAGHPGASSNGFNENLVTTNGGPGYASTNITFLVYAQSLLQFDVGGGSAGGIIAVILANIVAIFLMRMIDKNLEV